MDRVELGIKIEQINKLQEKGDFSGAAKVADTIEWRKVKKWSELSLAEELYEKAGRFRDARNICVYAYNRNLGGRRLVYKLTELSILINDLDEADDLYKEFVEVAPQDSGRYVLLYKLNKARGVSVDRLIEILEEYKDHELEEQYEYELATLYAKVGRMEDCFRECDDLILWFNEGEFVEKALLLKKEHGELTSSQEEKLQDMRIRAALPPMEESEPQTEGAEEDVQEDAPERQIRTSINVADIEIPEKDYSVYDTQNIQAELAKSMQIIMSGKQIRAEVSSIPGISPVISEETDKAVEEADGVDEPTKEIRINSHHWNRIGSVMVDDITPVNLESLEFEMEAAEVAETDAQADTFSATEVEDTDSLEEEAAESEETEDVAEEGFESEEDVEELESEEDASNAIIEDVIENTIETVIPEEMEDTIEAVSEDGLNHEDVEQTESVSATVPTVTETEVEALQTDEDNVITEEIIESLVEVPEVETPVFAKDPEADIPEDSVIRPLEPVVVPFPTVPVQPVAVAVPEEEPVEGQISLLDWLMHAPEVSEEVQEEISEPATVITEEAADIHTSLDELMEEEERSASEAEEEESNALESETEEEAAVELQHSEPLSPEEEAESEEAMKEAMSHLMEEVAGYSEPEAEESAEDDGKADDNMEPAEEEFVLNIAERKYLKKYLFMKGMEETVTKVLRGKQLETSDGTSLTGNIVIAGKSEIDKTSFAISLFKALHAGQDQAQLKVARTPAAVLNRKGIGASIDKIRGTTLIVEGVGALTKQTARELSDFMAQDTDDMLVIFTGEDYEVKRLFAEHPHLADKFSYSIELKHYSVNELVSIAKEYARVRGFMIEDKALLKLYLKVGEIASSDIGEEMDKVKEIIDHAIEACGKKGKSLFGKRGTLVALKEKYFR